MEMVHDTDTVSSIVLLVEQVDSSIFDNRGKMVTLDEAPMTTEDALARLFPTLLGIHPMFPIQGCQPDISFGFQPTDMAGRLPFSQTSWLTNSMRSGQKNLVLRGKDRFCERQKLNWQVKY